MHSNSNLVKQNKYLDAPNQHMSKMPLLGSPWASSPSVPGNWFLTGGWYVKSSCVFTFWAQNNAPFKIQQLYLYTSVNKGECESVAPFQGPWKSETGEGEGEGDSVGESPDRPVTQLGYVSQKREDRRIPLKWWY